MWQQIIEIFDENFRNFDILRVKRMYVSLIIPCKVGAWILRYQSFAESNNPILLSNES